MHEAADGGLVVRSFQPQAERVWLIEADSRAARPASCRGSTPTACSSLPLPDRTARFAYRLRLEVGRETVEIDDPYRFPPVLGELDVYLIAEGNHLSLYEKLGAHPMERRRRRGHRLPGLGAERQAGLAWSATSTAGTAAATRCASASSAASGSCSCPGLARGDGLQVRDQGAERRAPAAQGRPARPSPPSMPPRTASVVDGPGRATPGRIRRG